MDFNNTQIAFNRFSDADIKWQTLLFNLMSKKSLVSIGAFLTKKSFELHLPIKSIVKKTMFFQFCGGEDFEECSRKILPILEKDKIEVSLHYSIEGDGTEKDYTDAYEKTLELIQKQGAQKNETRKFSVIKPSGLISLEILHRWSDNVELTSDEKNIIEIFKKRMHNLALSCAQTGGSLLVDAEETWIQPAIDQTVYELMKTFNSERAVVYTTAQMYRKDRFSYLKELVKKAPEEGFFLGVKLVRGAYMVLEAEFAAKHNKENPIFAEKTQTDKSYNDGLEFIFQNLNHIYLFLGTHNEISAQKFVEHYDKLTQYKDHVVSCQLYGMGDHLTYNLAYYGYPACKYVPYGPVEKALPYLIRRAQENTAVLDEVGRELRLRKYELRRRCN